MPMKFVMGSKDGRTVQKEIDAATAKQLYGKKLGDTIKGDAFGFAGYEFLITGGSDDCGFPMRADVGGFARRKLLFVEGIGMRKTEGGVRHRKTVCGQVISPKIVQLNLKVTVAGKEPLAPPKEGEKAEPDKKEAAPKEEKKA